MHKHTCLCACVCECMSGHIWMERWRACLFFDIYTKISFPTNSAFEKSVIFFVFFQPGTKILWDSLSLVTLILLVMPRYRSKLWVKVWYTTHIQGTEALTSNIPAFVHLYQSSSTALSVEKERDYGLVIWPVVSVLQKIWVSQDSRFCIWWVSVYLSLSLPSKE